MRKGCKNEEWILPYREKRISIQVGSFDFPNFYQVDRAMVGESLGAMRVLNIDEECYFWI